MEIYQFILAVLGGVIVTAYIIYKIREKSPRFRIVEGNITDNVYDISRYIPQVKLEGRWFYINKFGGTETTISNAFLDPHDAIVLIDKFKSAGNYTIPSNEKLKSNQKAIIVE